MKKMRCTSCGAELKVKEDKEYAVCEHCGSSYKLNEDVNINFKMDDNMKDVLKQGMENTKKFSKFMLIPVGIFFVFFIGMIFFAFSTEKDFNKRQEENKQQMEEKAKEAAKEAEKEEEESKKHSFNFQFTGDAGTNNGIMVRNTLDEIIESNKNYDRKVTLVYNGESTTDEARIIEIKHGLGDWDDYEVVVNKDEDGYINEIKVDKVA